MKRSRLARAITLVVLAAISLFLIRVDMSFAQEEKPVEKPAYQPGPMLAKMLAGPLADSPEIVFAARVSGRDHWYVSFGNYAWADSTIKQRAFKFEDDVYWGYGEGGRLCRYNLATGEMKILLDDPKGGVRDPQLHYDGQKILFSYRPGGSHTYHLYEIDIDGENLRQLTDGPDDDIEPLYLPDGNIMFCSSRCRRFVNCWFSRVAVLYRCDGDGKNIRILSSNNDHDNTPWMLPDGRILYMRWEYVDRSQVHFHHLWTTNPDGTNQTVFYGNSFGGIAMLDAKPIPGTRKIVASFSPGHGRYEHMGKVAILDPSTGPDDQKAYREITKSSEWRDPYALTEDCFLVASPRGIFVMDGQGNAELVYQLPEDLKHMQCHEPRPLRSRPREPAIPDRTETRLATGRLILEDIYEGRRMQSVERGTIKKLLVLKQLPKPVNYSGGMEPLTIGGSFTLAEIVGEVPVEPDGSAYMDLPALQSLFFVALDEKDQPVKRMHSFVTLQPGELTSCVGCHEQRVRTPHLLKKDMLAMRKTPQPVTPISDVPQVMDFPRDIQPILDKHCVKCHNPDRREGGIDLCGDKTERYTMSYRTIIRHGLISDGRNRAQGNYEPYTYGSVVSRLMQLIDEHHYDVTVTPHERKLIRLWIETSATYPGTYASLGSGTYKAYLPQAEMVGRCGACHKKHLNDQWGERDVVMLSYGMSSERPQTLVNLSRPEKSIFLRAPLAKGAGGLGLCKEATFQDTTDPLYQKMLASIKDASRRLDEGKRFDMPGFRPDPSYIREMQRFGFIPKDLGADEPVDVYKIDRAYWDSFLCPNVVENGP